jgi:hypothetical protein
VLFTEPTVLYLLCFLDLTPLNRSRYNVVVFGLKQKGDLNGQEAFQT